MNKDSFENSDDKSGCEPVETEALIAEYQEMREELRINAQLLNTRISRGITAIGAVIGYALLAEGGSEFISVVPFIIAIIYLLSLNSIQNMLLVSRHVYEIEKEMLPEKFRWEHQYGGLLPHTERETSWSKYRKLDLTDLPSLIVGGFAALIYIAFLVLSYHELSGWELALFVLFYLILTILLVASTISYYIVFNKLQLNSDYSVSTDSESL